jgi:hypothetical protein
VDTTALRADLLRQWWILLAGALLTAAGIALVILTVPLIYGADGTAVMVPPAVQSADNPAVANPFLSFSGSLNVVAALTIQALQDKATADSLRHQGATASYVLGTGADGKTPLITVTAKSTSPATSMHTATLVLQAVQFELGNLQQAEHAPVGTFITATVIDHPDHATKSWSGRTKDLALVIVLGLLVTFAASEVARRRYQRQLADEAAYDDEEPLALFDVAAVHQRGVM